MPKKRGSNRHHHHSGILLAVRQGIIVLLEWGNCSLSLSLSLCFSQTRLGPKTPAKFNLTKPMKTADSVFCGFIKVTRTVFMDKIFLLNILKYFSIMWANKSHLSQLIWRVQSEMLETGQTDHKRSAWRDTIINGLWGKVWVLESGWIKALKFALEILSPDCPGPYWTWTSQEIGSFN